MAGTGLYWGRGEEAAAAARRGAADPGVPQRPRARLPARRPRAARSRARASAGLRGADVALVIGAPLDFRLGFGAAFAQDAEIIVIDVAEPDQDPPAQRRRRALRRPAGDPRRVCGRRRGPGSSRGPTREAWIASLRADRTIAAPARPPSSPTCGRRSTRCGSMASWSSCSSATRSWSATAATSSPSPAASRLLPARAAGSIPGRSAASAPGPATRSPPSSRTPSARSCCCSATAPSASPGWSSTRSLATAWRRRRRRQQRHLGAREAPDGGHLRLFGRRRPAPRDPLRPGRHGARLPRRARSHAGGAAAGARASARQPAGRRWSTC